MATCRGIDVSAYQGPQDWAAHARAGVVFAFVKASEGRTTKNAAFGRHVDGARAAGLVVGGYHFGWPTQDVAAEAANYIAAVRSRAQRGFVHWLDLERYPDGRNYAGQNNAEIRAWAARWIALVSEAFPGQRVGVYTSADDIAAGRVPAGAPLWYPAYPWGQAEYARAEAAQQPRPSGRAPLFWQFTSQPIDRSICYLAADALRQWAAGDDDTDKETDMPLTSAEIEKVAERVLRKDGLISIPGAPASNPTWTLASAQTEILKRLDKANATLSAQSAAITALAGQLGQDVDTAAVVAAVEKAIADAVVKVDVSVEGTGTTPAG